jgi:hypothetical protein
LKSGTTPLWFIHLDFLGELGELGELGGSRDLSRPELTGQNLYGHDGLSG